MALAERSFGGFNRASTVKKDGMLNRALNKISANREAKARENVDAFLVSLDDDQLIEMGIDADRIALIRSRGLVT